MSQENVDFVRSLFGAWERGDYSSTEWADTEIEYVIADGPAPATRTGLAGLAEGARYVASGWEGFRTKADEYRALDDERVLVFIQFGGRGKASGLEVGQTRAQGAQLFHVREGKVTRIVLYFDRDRALADLGLKE
jgi:ketosteroid isomerase-like protein